ncbi:TPA: hypothetical protein QDA90_005883 [Burkholderia vietnamiensis]|uniref:hypothetical protein n=1 Tax=Burkholderia vietnamiensis TaxID=60552 RepID=UPI00298BA582|nr:hypothetical protein [Burkholderia vietnamiensis]
MKIGIKFLARCAIAVAALASIRYSVLNQNVDVSVPAACVAGVATKVVQGENRCLYQNVTVRGHVLQRNFEVYGSTGIGFYTKDAFVASRSNDAGFTWRSLVLLLIAVAMWAPSLLSLFKSKDRLQDEPWKAAVYNPKQYRRDR